jgi:hypothetical protein
MDEWEASARLTFIEVPLNNPGVVNYIIFNDHPSANNSNLGKNLFNGSQNINMTSWGYPQTKAIIMHEIGHALGLWHEQARSDRDTYVEIRNENIDDDFEDQFFLVANSENIGDYDFGSVMHYGRKAFSINGLDTIVAKPGFEAFQNVIGQREGLSDLDRAGMAAKYGALTPTSAPGFSPPPGNYNNPIQFSLNIIPAIDMGNTRYFYTLDGSEPTISSTEYFQGDVIPINTNTTVKYFALQRQHSPSVVVSANYTFTNPTPMVVTPVLNPPSGTYAPGTMFSASTTTPDAQIYLSFGPTVPSQNGFLYTAPFPLNNNTQISAKAFKAGHTPSGVASANYEIQANQLAPPPGFHPDPSAQDYPGPLNVYLINDSTVLGANLHYTLDGSEPTTASPLFSETPLILTQDTTIKAKIFRDGFTPSLTSTASYTVIPSADVPSIDPNGGSFDNSVSVSLSLPAKSDKGTGPQEYIFYTTNGADPQSFSTRYTAPFNLGVGNHTVKARTIYPGLPPSAIAQAQFTVYSTAPTLDPPEYTPVGRDHATSVQVTLESFTEDAEIRYTVGDNMQPADPTLASTLYTGPFTLGLPMGGGDFWFVKARSFKDGGQSLVQAKTYSVFTPLGTIDTPTFSPPGGTTYYNPVTVAMSATTDPNTTGIQIFRTTNGAEPVVPDPPTGGTNLNVNLSSDTELKAIAYRGFFGASGIASATYTFKCASPTIEAEMSKGVSPYGSLSIVMSSLTVGGNTTIRYATGGAEPDVDSTEYTGPIELGVGTHIFKAKTFRFNFEDSDTAVASFIVETTPQEPTILADPEDAMVDLLEDHTFVASATGIPDPEYSWYFQASGATQPVRLAGETESSLTLFRVLQANAGTYFMVAENSSGSATTTPALLQVIEIDTPTPTETVVQEPTVTPTHTLETDPTATFSNTPTVTATEPEDATPTLTPTPTITSTPTELMAQSVVLGASQDNTLFETDDGSVSNGAGPHINVGRIGTNGTSPRTLRRGVIAFDVASLPAGATVLGVTLTLNMSKTNSGAVNIALHALDATWGEAGSSENQGQGDNSEPGDATWIHRFFDTTAWSSPGGDFESVASASRSVGNSGKYSWTSSQMASDVQEWLDNPASNAGWILIANESGLTKTVKQFDSKEISNPTNRPALEISFVAMGEDPTPTPTLETPTQTPTPTPTQEGEPEATATPLSFTDVDIVPDDEINSTDLLALLEALRDGTFGGDVDVNNDLEVNDIDLLELIKRWKEMGTP